MRVDRILAPILESCAYSAHCCAQILCAGKAALAKQIPEEALAAIEEVVRRDSNGMSAPEFLRALATPVPPRTLQYRLMYLVTRNRLVMKGEGRWARYRLPDAAIHTVAGAESDEPVIPLSEAGTAIREYVGRGPEARKPVDYDRKFLDRYRPNTILLLDRTGPQASRGRRPPANRRTACGRLRQTDPQPAAD